MELNIENIAIILSLINLIAVVISLITLVAHHAAISELCDVIEQENKRLKSLDKDVKVLQAKKY